MESVVPVLVGCLSCEHNPDIMLYAARALTWLADVVPSSCAAIVRHDAVAALCSRLLAIQYIDVAEQSLQALDKISTHHPESCLRQVRLLPLIFFPLFVGLGLLGRTHACAPHVRLNWVQRCALGARVSCARCEVSCASNTLTLGQPTCTTPLGQTTSDTRQHWCRAA